MSLTKPTLNNLRAAGTTVGDLYFPQTKLLLPFEGTNGATTTSDLSNNNLSLGFVGTAQISTAQSKLGSSSLLLDGNSDYLTFDLPTLSSTFTVEFWFRASTFSTNNSMITNYGGSTTGWWIQYTNGYLKVGFAGNSPHITSTTTLSTDTWYHVALSGSAGSYKLFLNGTQEGSTYTGSTQLAGRSEASIGALYSGGYTGLFHGYIDDMRVTSGAARYTSNFTPPTTAYLTSAGDVNKQIIVNSAADGVAIGTGGINQSRIAKAWVNFNGTGTVAIRDSYNVGSITDNGAGTYTVNFSTAMTNANYCCNMNSGDKAVVWGIPLFDGLSTFLAGSCKIVVQHPNDTPTDNPIVCASFFGN
jgi:hypothetical protein